MKRSETAIAHRTWLIYICIIEAWRRRYLDQDLTAFFQHCTFIYIQNYHANHLTIVSEENLFLNWAPITGYHVLQKQHPENLFVIWPPIHFRGDKTSSQNESQGWKLYSILWTKISNATDLIGLKRNIDFFRCKYIYFKQCIFLFWTQT
jgi:hypothetical protein